MLFTDYILRILTAGGLGLLIGYERQKTGHPAGIQTNVLVCLGACVFQITAFVLGAADLTRVAAQIVTGVGFLGSGIIFKDGINVRGVNTAATIWCGAAIGILCASGELYFAAAAAVIIIAVNITFQQRSPAAAAGANRSNSGISFYTLYVVCRAAQAMEIRTLILDQLPGSKLTLTDLKSADQGADTLITAGVYHSHARGPGFKGRRGDAHIEKLAARLSACESVSSVKWELV